MIRLSFNSILLICVMSSFLHAADQGPSNDDLLVLAERIFQARCNDRIEPIDGEFAQKFIEAPEGSSAAQLWDHWKRVITQSRCNTKQYKPSVRVSPRTILRLRRQLQKGQTDFDPAICAHLEKFPSGSPQARLLEHIRSVQAPEKDNHYSGTREKPPASQRPIFCCVGDYKRWEAQFKDPRYHQSKACAKFRRPGQLSPRKIRRVRVRVIRPSDLFDEEEEERKEPLEQTETPDFDEADSGECVPDSDSDDRSGNGFSLRSLIARLSRSTGYASD